ncbi:MAG: ribonuclease Z [Archaeoglobi archaeon]|nr:ribonuclease Z [Candidatus Mnemosynella bozhongmuii]
MLKVLFLGTAGAVPTTKRNPSAILIQRDSEKILFDCGEGTQRQMMKAKSGMKIDAIFITHLHGDHILGLPGLIQSMNFQERKEPLYIYTPLDTREEIEKLVTAGSFLPSFEIIIEELKPGDEVRREGYRIRAIRAVHVRNSLGFVLEEDMRKGKFNREKAEKVLGIPPGPLYAKLHSGEPIVWKGRVIHPSEVVGPPRRGRKIVYTGDTRPHEELVREAMNADLLIHDSTFSEAEKDMAIETAHSTAMEAAEVALRAKVRRLILTHISSRYSSNPQILEEEARKIFPETIVAEDLMEVEVPYPEE